jgi:hypothetical protein
MKLLFHIAFVLFGVVTIFSNEEVEKLYTSGEFDLTRCSKTNPVECCPGSMYRCPNGYCVSDVAGCYVRQSCFPVDCSGEVCANGILIIEFYCFKF